MVFFPLCDDRNQILHHGLQDNHDQQNYQMRLQASVKILGIESGVLFLVLPSMIPTPSTIAL